MTARRKLLTATLGDQTAERVRRSHAEAIEELQRLARPAASVPIDIPASMAQQHNVAGTGNQFFSAGQNDPGDYWGNSTSDTLRVSFPLSPFVRRGDAVRNLRLLVREGNAAGETVTGTLYHMDRIGGRTQVSVAKTSGVRNIDSSLVWDAGDAGFPFVVEEGRYILDVLLAQASTLAEIRAYGCVVNG